MGLEGKLEEKQLILISETENLEVKAALGSLDFIEEKPSKAVSHNNPKVAVYVSEKPSLLEDALFDHLLDIWKDTHFFVIPLTKSDSSDSQRKRKYKEGDSERISEYSLDVISSPDGRLDFKSQLIQRMDEKRLKPVQPKDIILYMNNSSKYFKSMDKILKELGIASYVECNTFAELKYHIFRGPTLIVVGQEHLDEMKKLKKEYQGKLMIVAERPELDKMKPNGAITLSYEPEKYFKDSFREYIKLLIEATKGKESKISLLDATSNNFLFIITGPACAGKSSSIDEYINKHKDSAAKVIISTTRKRRPGEINDKDMIFLNKKDFDINAEIKGLFMHIYSRDDGVTKVDYGVPQTTLDYLNEGYDVFLHTKHVDIIEELITTGKVPKEKIVPVLINASDSNLKQRFFSRGDLLSTLTPSELKHLSENFGRMTEETEKIIKRYCEKVNQHKYTQLHISNDADLDRLAKMMNNIVTYCKNSKSSGLTFEDSITRSIFGFNFNELRQGMSVNLEVSKNNVESLMSNYIMKIISKDEELTFYNNLFNLTEFKIYNTKSEGIFGRIVLELNDSKKVKESYKKIANLVEPKNILIEDVLIELFKASVDYDAIEEFRADTSKISKEIILNKEFLENKGVVWNISDPISTDTSCKIIKSLSIYFK